ncbi:polysaccharide pyruvyl transferase family protein [Billgrantia lactosivorans]|uniref:polysaccharide pyruvyl transferase family protein n=1 Tax=Billgrantia lactosivorans TaxID=2185141 RepID=UPI000DAE1D18|nr:polysaccharide pyruvyl transferase family protein [Halomonas lactosivorans]
MNQKPKKVVIIGTYPEHGSRNIGDQLITTCLTEVIESLCDAKIDVIWRADQWTNVREKILKADHVFFACLAIRHQMHNKEYPYLKQIIESGIPFSVIAAGTSLPVHERSHLFSNISKDSLSLLLSINERAAVFTTRGVVTQEFCYHHGLKAAKLAGDVAFYSKQYAKRVFIEGKRINTIVISDPHHASAYLGAFRKLHANLSSMFPEARILVAQHGASDVVESFCREQNIECVKIYEHRYDGLGIYAEADLHVGFRVHGHVSALKRRVYSYLLEQDGRGCDYGLTLDKRISVPNYLMSNKITLNNIAKSLLKRSSGQGAIASTVPADILTSMIRQDQVNGFAKFTGLEDQIESFNSNTYRSVQTALLGA